MSDACRNTGALDYMKLVVECQNATSVVAEVPIFSATQLCDGTVLCGSHGELLAQDEESGFPGLCLYEYGFEQPCKWVFAEESSSGQQYVWSGWGDRRVVLFHYSAVPRHVAGETGASKLCPVADCVVDTATDDWSDVLGVGGSRGEVIVGVATAIICLSRRDVAETSQLCFSVDRFFSSVKMGLRSFVVLADADGRLDLVAVTKSGALMSARVAVEALPRTTVEWSCMPLPWDSTAVAAVVVSQCPFFLVGDSKGQLHSLRKSDVAESRRLDSTNGSSSKEVCATALKTVQVAVAFENGAVLLVAGEDYPLGGRVAVRVGLEGTAQQLSITALGEISFPVEPRALLASPKPQPCLRLVACDESGRSFCCHFPRHSVLAPAFPQARCYPHVGYDLLARDPGEPPKSRIMDGQVESLEIQRLKRLLMEKDKELADLREQTAVATPHGCDQKNWLALTQAAERLGASPQAALIKMEAIVVDSPAERLLRRDVETLLRLGEYFATQAAIEAQKSNIIFTFFSRREKILEEEAQARRYVQEPWGRNP